MLHRIVGDGVVLVVDQLLELGSEPLDCLTVKRLRADDTLGGAHRVKPVGERRRIKAEHHASIAFEKAPAAIPGKARMTAHAQQTVHRSQRAADVKHRIEHAGHRAGGA